MPPPLPTTVAVPAGQVLVTHAALLEEPVCSVTAPPEHAVHVPTLVAPDAADHVPMAHGVHAVPALSTAPPLPKDPAGHGVQELCPGTAA